MTKTPEKYEHDRVDYERRIVSNLTKYKRTYGDYMNHVYDSAQEKTIGNYCGTQNTQNGDDKCKNVNAKQKIDEIITNMRTDITEINNQIKNLGDTAQTTENDFNNEELEYATEQKKLKNIKQKNAESIMMKKITEDNQAINIVESIYLVSGISFMVFFIWKQLNK